MQKAHCDTAVSYVTKVWLRVVGGSCLQEMSRGLSPELLVSHQVCFLKIKVFQVTKVLRHESSCVTKVLFSCVSKAECHESFLHHLTLRQTVSPAEQYLWVKACRKFLNITITVLVGQGMS